jgi:hypothetical protein
VSVGCVAAIAPGITGWLSAEWFEAPDAVTLVLLALLDVTVVHWSSSSSAGIASHSPSASNTVSIVREPAFVPKPDAPAFRFFFLFF